jgi:ABC-type glycerol-3-phosphate transport system substrate-binding protein
MLRPQWPFGSTLGLTSCSSSAFALPHRLSRRPYEGLTVDFLEVAFAAGGGVLSGDGRRSVINSPESVRGLRFMADGIRTGAAPSVVTFLDEFGVQRILRRRPRLHA